MHQDSTNHFFCLTHHSTNTKEAGSNSPNTKIMRLSLSIWVCLAKFAWLTNQTALAFTPNIARSRNNPIRMSRRALSNSSPSGDAIVQPQPQQQQQQETMEETYNRLAREIVETFHQKRNDRRLWLALAGAPGSGKTTVAKHLVERIHALSSLRATVVPMDGYHFTQQQMADMEYDMKRRGAPWTFDATRMYQDLSRARQRNNEDVLLPDYSRDISDPVPDKIKLEANHDIVIIEGLYVLLGTLCQELDQPDSPTTQVAAELAALENIVDVRQEVQRWEPLMEIWHETLYVEPPGGFQENKRRLVERSLKTWTPAKTELWLPGATDREAATKRVELNDERNAKLIECCKRYASVVIQNK